jgi:hypothetical protein
MNHHAYVYVGSDVTVLPEHIRTPGIDIEHIVCERFGIADARRLKQAASVRPQQAAVQHIVVRTSVIPAEAQNALLKLLEEPPATTVLHICVPQRDMLLPTVLSRVVVETDTYEEPHVSADFNTFIAASYGDRLEQIQTAQKKKDSDFFTTIAAGAERYVADQTVTAAQKRTIINAVSLLKQPGAAKKMVLEDIALTLPYQGSGRVL